MEEFGIQQGLVPASTVAVAICTSSGPQAPSEFVAVMKVVLAVLAIGVTLYTLYLSLRSTRGAAPNQQAMQEPGNQNTQDMEVDGPPLGRIGTSGERMSVSNEAIVTIPSSSEATPSLPVQELVQSNVHALEITSQLMVST